VTLLGLLFASWALDPASSLLGWVAAGAQAGLLLGA
jgi:hypothetical protein